MSSGLSILVDLDGIVADLHSAWHERALLCCGPGGQTSGRVREPPPTLDEVLQTYDGWGSLPCGEDHVYDHLDHNLFDGLDPIDGAIEALRLLKSLGHEVTIASASAMDPQTAAAKLSWVDRHLGWSRHSVMIVQRKHMIRGDVFIDDAPKNLRAWKAANPDGLAMTIAYPYNREVIGDIQRFDSWKETDVAWARMVRRIAEFAEERS